MIGSTKWMRGASALALVSMLMCQSLACSSGDDVGGDTPETPVATNNLYELVSSLPSLSTLKEAIDTAELADTLRADGAMTLFAPPNDAFDALPEGALAEILGDRAQLEALLTGHLADTRQLSMELAQLTSITMLNAATYELKVDGDDLLVDNVRVRGPDVEATNGVLHIMEGILGQATPAAPVCGDGSCDGSEVCPEDCDETDPVSECGDGVCDDGEDCIEDCEVPGPECGDGTCDMGEDCPADCDAPLGNIIEVAEGAGIFTTLLAAVDAAGLTETLATGGPFTVFAPTDEAFAALPEGTVEALLADIPMLTQILQYHVADSALLSDELLLLESLATLLGEDISITLTPAGLVLNDTALITSADVMASNGVIHVLDAVLLPPSDPGSVCGDGVCDDGEECPEDCDAPLGNIIEVATAAGNFTTLLAAVDAASLTETLATGGPFTVLAPTDDAFDLLPEGLVAELLQDIPALTDILLYHVIDGAAPASVVVTLDSATTLLGKDVTITVTDEGVFLNDTVKVSATDVMASNGVIHVIDAVLLPPSDPGPVCGDDTCDDGETSDTCPADCDAPLGNIIEVAEGAGVFTTLLAAVEAASLTETLATGGPFTVLAPTDDAFGLLPEGLVAGLLQDIPALTDILLYHVVDGIVPADVVVTLPSATTLLGKDVTITVTDDGVFLNDTVKVSATDVMASNGVIHVIDAVLLPPSDPGPVCGDDVCDPAEDCPEDCDAPLGNIIEVAEGAGIFTTLLAAVDAAGLTETLATGGPFTVFAPTDDAFGLLPEGVVSGLLADIPALTDILLYHVVDGIVPAEVVVTLPSAT
ncbi:MAG: fasciclin domain-containing protein, partial [Myxococcota bacterium]